MIKALFLDIDGTLVSFDTHIIAPSTIDALNRAKSRGIQIFIATGRPLAIINNLQPIEHLIDGYITANGAYCFTGDNEVLCKPIPRKDVELVIQLSDELNFSCIVVSKTGIMVHNADELFDKIFRNMLNVTNINDNVPVSGFIEDTILQLTPLITPEQESRIMPLLPGCMSTRWYPAFTDITLTGIDKAAGIDAFVARLGIKLTETMAIGDGGNDIAMLQHAGIGVAMGNASDEVKAAADYVTTSVENDGIRNALVRFNVIA